MENKIVMGVITREDYKYANPRTEDSIYKLLVFGEYRDFTDYPELSTDTHDNWDSLIEDIKKKGGVHKTGKLYRVLNTKNGKVSIGTTGSIENLIGAYVLEKDDYEFVAEQNEEHQDLDAYLHDILMQELHDWEAYLNEDVQIFDVVAPSGEVLLRGVYAYAKTEKEIQQMVETLYGY